MTVQDMLQRMTSEELSEHMAFDVIRADEMKRTAAPTRQAPPPARREAPTATELRSKIERWLHVD